MVCRIVITSATEKDENIICSITSQSAMKELIRWIHHHSVRILLKFTNYTRHIRSLSSVWKDRCYAPKLQSHWFSYCALSQSACSMRGRVPDRLICWKYTADRTNCELNWQTELANWTGELNWWSARGPFFVHDLDRDPFRAIFHRNGGNKLQISGYVSNDLPSLFWL